MSHDDIQVCSTPLEEMQGAGGKRIETKETSEEALIQDFKQAISPGSSILVSHELV
jgi:hypothetical protein